MSHNECIFWQKLNVIVLKKGVTNPDFKRFMAASAQANWNVVHIIYGNKDPIVKMIDKEQTCFLHSTLIFQHPH
jgi:hypothetical protein